VRPKGTTHHRSPFNIWFMQPFFPNGEPSQDPLRLRLDSFPPGCNRTGGQHLNLLPRFVGLRFVFALLDTEHKSIPEDE
jgi:hypothetical protein